MSSLNLPMLTPGPPAESDSTRWATVTAIGPLRIKLDGETAALPFTPTTLLNDLLVGDRVLVILLTNADRLRRARRVVILGKGQTTTTFVQPPIGVVWDFAGSTAPAGWAICDGAALNRITEAPLFAVIGTSYGVGDGSTTFNIPNAKGRVAVGRDAGDGQFDTLGETGGEKNHTLTASELPDHVHGWNGSSAAASTTTDQPARGAGPGDPNFRMQGELYASETYASAQLTNGQAHNNLQPYLVMNKIIRLR